MKLYLYGHDYKYAVEQMLLTMFPEQRPEYPAGRPEGDRMEIRLSRGGEYVTATCALHLGGRLLRGRAAAKNGAADSPLEDDRRCQRIIKNSM